MTTTSAHTGRQRRSNEPATSPVVRAVELYKAIDEHPILRGIDLELATGGCLALLGSNGAGKSTLLHVLATLAAATDGTLELFGVPIKRSEPAVRRRIGLIAHQPMTYPALSASENLRLVGGLYGIPAPARRADELLEQVGLLDRAADPVGTFSRGMRQRLAIARALVHEPELLLADEPFAGLDAEATQRIEALLHELHQAGRTIVFSSHDIPQAISLADRVVVLGRGRIRFDKPIEQCDVASILQILRTG
ncbi:MAG: ABC transporter ATP-binding protein [bacterium]